MAAALSQCFLLAMALFPNADAVFPAIAAIICLVWVNALLTIAIAVLFTISYLFVVGIVSDWWSESMYDMWAQVSGWFFAVSLAWVVGGIFRYLRYKRAAVQKEFEISLLHQRRELAKELHDTVSRSNTLIVLTIEKLLGEQVPTDLRRELTRILEEGRRVSNSLQAMMLDLSDSAGGMIGVAPTVTVAATLGELQDLLRIHGFLPRVLVELSDKDIPTATIMWCNRCLREAVCNIVRHGEPPDCRILISAESGNCIEVMCANVISKSAQRDNDNGFGIPYLRASLRNFGGTLVCGPSLDGHEWVFLATVPNVGVG